MSARFFLWIATLAYSGGFLSIDNGFSSAGMIITAAFLGALLGLLVAMFSRS